MHEDEEGTLTLTLKKTQPLTLTLTLTLALTITLTLALITYWYKLSSFRKYCRAALYLSRYREDARQLKG